jgi:hypothetical protein
VAGIAAVVAPGGSTVEAPSAAVMVLLIVWGWRRERGPTLTSDVVELDTGQSPAGHCRPHRFQCEPRALKPVVEDTLIFWSRTEDGWAVNLDGTDAGTAFALPRVELRSSPRGWVCGCRLPDGTSRLVPLGHPAGVTEAMRLAIEGSLGVLGGEHEAELRALLDAPTPH